MSDPNPKPSSIGSLIASRRRQRSQGQAPDPAAGKGLKARFRQTAGTVLEGYVLDEADPDRRFVVELLLNGRPAGIARAELFDALLGASASDDGCHGFCFHLDPEILPSLRVAAVRIANTAQTVADPIAFGDDPSFAASGAPAGRVEWLGGRRLSGWVRRDAGAFPPLVEARLDGARVAFARADIWRTVSNGAGATAEPGFELTLPSEIADGRAKRVHVTCAGRALPGSPVSLIAFADGLEDFLLARAETEAEAPRGRLFDERFPGCVPLGDLDAWERRFPLHAPADPPAGPVAVVVIGEEGAEETLSGPLFTPSTAWVGAILAASGGPTRFAADDLLRFLDEEAADCTSLVFLPAGALARPLGLDRLVAALDADPSAETAYGDVLLRSDDGRAHPLALPAFDYERVLEQGIGASVFALRRAAAVGAARRGIGELHRLFLAPLDGGGLYRATHLHVPGFCAVVPPPGESAEALAEATRAHLSERGREADLVPREGGTLPAVRIRRPVPVRPLTILLDAGRDASRILPALDALETTRSGRSLSLLVMAPMLEESLRQDLKLAAIDVVESPPGISPARRLAAAMERAPGELVCLFDARLRPVSADWLEEILSRAAEPDVGAVAPLLLRPNGLVAEAGLVLRAAGSPAPAYADRRHGDPGHGDALTVARQVAALGPACLLARRADFLALGGFDPVLFPDHFGAADFCLKLQALGRRVLVTPDAVLAYGQGLAPEPEEDASTASSRLREEEVLRARWAHVLAADPFYSPLLGRGMRPFSGLAWPPGDMSPRRPSILPALAVPPGW